MKHTPGPWRYYHETMAAGNGLQIHFETVEADGENLVRLHNKADAQHIAAAPDMLAMLEELEWSVRGAGGVLYCPVCKVAKQCGHPDDCKLDNLLKRIKGDK